MKNHHRLVERKHEQVVDHCARQGIVFVPYFPLREVGSPALERIAEAHSA